jgi:hypothetical protein
MANEENLKIIRTESEAREKGKKGGIASGESRRRKKTLKELMNSIATMPLQDGKLTDIDKIKSLASAKGKNITVEEAFVLKLTQKALSGDYKAMRLWVELMGEDTSKDGDEPQDNDGLIDSIEEAAKLWQCD